MKYFKKDKKGRNVFHMSEKQKALLNADLSVIRARTWKKALKQYLEDPKDFYRAWRFCTEHPANQRILNKKWIESWWKQNHSLMIMKVNSETKRVEDNKPNTETNIWIEWGPYMESSELQEHEREFLPQGISSHEHRVDTGGKTFEEAIVNIAHNIWMLYRDQKSVSNDAELKKKDRW